MKARTANSAVRERIMATARQLFYSAGYRATGINEIIKKSRVAKATFYAYFPSKEKLAYAYVQAMNEEEIRQLEEGIRQFPGPYEKLIGLLEFLIPWSEERDFRGCAYINISSEILDPANPVRRESQAHYDAVRRVAAQQMYALKEQRGVAWKNRDVEKMADEYLLLLTGALAMAQIYHHRKPLQSAIDAAKRLLA